MDHYCIYEINRNSGQSVFTESFTDYDEASEACKIYNEFNSRAKKFPCYWVVRKLDDIEFQDRYNYYPYANRIYIPSCPTNLKYKSLT